jgi:hypothetical protein
MEFEASRFDNKHEPVDVPLSKLVLYGIFDPPPRGAIPTGNVIKNLEKEIIEGRRIPEGVQKYTVEMVGPTVVSTAVYPDGSKEVRLLEQHLDRGYIDRGRVCSLTRYDSQGKIESIFNIEVSQPSRIGRPNLMLTITRADGTQRIITVGPFGVFTGSLGASDEITRSGGTKITNSMKPELAIQTIDGYWKLFKR